MSDLKVYWPEGDPATREPAPATQVETGKDSNEPEIYSFVDWVEKLHSPDSNSAAFRAQRLNAHQTCPGCQRVGVLPLMLNDGRIDNSGRMVPGSATLVGFRCQECHHEWSA